MQQNKKILVVDDDRLVLATLTHGLVEAGYEVIDADNGDDAIVLAREHQPDIALLDIRMNGKSGFDVAAYLREYCRIPFMFLSAFSDEETVNKVKALGAVAYLVKPLNVRQIIPAIETALSHVNRPVVDAPIGRALPADDPDTVLTQSVALAVGVLIQRDGVPRTTALQRLRQLALTESRTLKQQADSLLDAIERSSKTAKS